MSRATIDGLSGAIRAKSDGTSLRSHLAVTGQVARALLASAGNPGGSGILVAAAALHDLGKASERFQQYLDGGPYHCHEDTAPTAIREFCADPTSRDWLTWILGDCLSLDEVDGAPDDVIALAVTHHGRRRYVLGPGGGHATQLPAVSSWSAREDVATTEFDLLYRYRPHGGTVMLADQITSALQAGNDGLLVSVDIRDPGVAAPAGDLLDEAGAPRSTEESEMLPQGSGLQRLLLDGLGITRVEAARVAGGWELRIDRGSTTMVRIDV